MFCVGSSQAGKAVPHRSLHRTKKSRSLISILILTQFNDFSINFKKRYVTGNKSVPTRKKGYVTSRDPRVHDKQQMCIAIPSNGETQCTGAQMGIWCDDYNDSIMVSYRVNVDSANLTCLVYPMLPEHSDSLTTKSVASCLFEQEEPVLYRSMNIVDAVPLRHIKRDDGFHMFVLGVSSWDPSLPIEKLISMSFKAFQEAGDEVCEVVFGAGRYWYEPSVIAFYEEIAFAINTEHVVGHDLVIIVPPTEQSKATSIKAQEQTKLREAVELLHGAGVMTPREKFIVEENIAAVAVPTSFAFSIVWQFSKETLFLEDRPYLPLLGLIHNDHHVDDKMPSLTLFTNMKLVDLPNGFHSLEITRKHFAEIGVTVKSDFGICVGDSRVIRPHLQGPMKYTWYSTIDSEDNKENTHVGVKRHNSETPYRLKRTVSFYDNNGVKKTKVITWKQGAWN